MRRLAALITVLAMVLTAGFSAAEGFSGIMDLFQSPETTATPAPNAFRFRDGIRWGMNKQQVSALEPGQMTERTRMNWSVMLTNEKVQVSVFSADLVFMFRDDRLMMASYDFQNGSADTFLYLTGALGSLYGEKTQADPLKIKALMDAVNPNMYRAEMITQPNVWTAADGTTIYLYYYSQTSFAITYAGPEMGVSIYQVNGL